MPSSCCSWACYCSPLHQRTMYAYLSPTSCANTSVDAALSGTHMVTPCPRCRAAGLLQGHARQDCAEHSGGRAADGGQGADHHKHSCPPQQVRHCDNNALQGDRGAAGGALRAKVGAAASSRPTLCVQGLPCTAIWAVTATSAQGGHGHAVCFCWFVRDNGMHY